VTEAEWLACTEADKMLDFLEGKASERKLRLFAVAYTRRVWGNMNEPSSRRTLEAIERYADGGASDEEMSLAAADALLRHYLSPAPSWGVLSRPRWASVSIDIDRAAETAARRGVKGTGGDYGAKYAVEMASLCVLLRDVVGNPFRPLPIINPAWQTPQVVALAQAAYDERELPAGKLEGIRLAVLADALEEVGCDNADTLSHLRGPGPHVRGCWALDLLLGKS
jgi:hypothetical protein